MMTEDVHATVGERLGRMDQRYTPGRRAVVTALLESDRPLSVDEIRECRPTLPKSTIYRTLGVLEQAKVVRRIEVVGDFGRFELAEELTGHHHHLVCIGCGTVVDFTASSRLERTVASVAAQIADDTGFRPEGHRLDLVGYCTSCG